MLHLIWGHFITVAQAPSTALCTNHYLHVTGVSNIILTYDCHCISLAIFMLLSTKEDRQPYRSVFNPLQADHPSDTKHVGSELTSVCIQWAAHSPTTLEPICSPHYHSAKQQAIRYIWAWVEINWMHGRSWADPKPRVFYESVPGKRPFTSCSSQHK